MCRPPCSAAATISLSTLTFSCTKSLGMLPLPPPTPYLVVRSSKTWARSCSCCLVSPPLSYMSHLVSLLSFVILWCCPSMLVLIHCHLSGSGARYGACYSDASVVATVSTIAHLSHGRSISIAPSISSSTLCNVAFRAPCTESARC